MWLKEIFRDRDRDPDRDRDRDRDYLCLIYIYISQKSRDWEESRKCSCFLSELGVRAFGDVHVVFIRRVFLFYNYIINSH